MYCDLLFLPLRIVAIYHFLKKKLRFHFNLNKHTQKNCSIFDFMPFSTYRVNIALKFGLWYIHLFNLTYAETGHLQILIDCNNSNWIKPLLYTYLLVVGGSLFDFEELGSCTAWPLWTEWPPEPLGFFKADFRGTALYTGSLAGTVVIMRVLRPAAAGGGCWKGLP